MKKLTRDEIQALTNDELNFRLFCLRPDYETTDRYRSEDKHNYCNSLDAQFELAKKFEFSFNVEYRNDRSLTFSAWTPLKTIAKRSGFKRTGAEVLLEAIQELEEVK